MQRAYWGRAIAGVAAAAGWAGLALQLAILVRGLGFAAGLWRYLGYFTILTNLGAALVATSWVLGRGDLLSSSRSRLTAATCILIVGLVYSIALRGLWSPSGWQRVSDVLLHDTTPLLWFVLWIAAAPAGLEWRDIKWAILPAPIYAAYSLARGAFNGWYPYWFLDPARQSAIELLMSIVLLLCAFALVAAFLIGLSRFRPLRPHPSAASRATSR
jgi:hypothetical protein